jgi:hypothetical protein
MDENQLFNAMQSHDAVLSALGPRKVFVSHPAENALVPDIGRKPIDAISSFVTGETS